MNRQEKRAKIKELQKSGIKKNIAKIYVEQNFSRVPLEEGTKVKLDYEFMRRHKDWKNQREDFKDWVVAHKDEVFTVEWDEARKKNNASDKKTWVCLKEDDTDPKWLFSTATLREVPMAKIKMLNGENFDVDISNATDYNSVMSKVQEEIENH